MRKFAEVFLIIIFVSVLSISISYSKCLEGDCNNGIGKASLAGVKTFEGTFVNGNPNGIGTMQYSNGHKIEGLFHGWQPVGKEDKLICSNGSEHEIDFSSSNRGSLAKKIKIACTVIVPVEINLEEESEIQRKLGFLDKNDKIKRDIALKARIAERKRQQRLEEKRRRLAAHWEKQRNSDEFREISSRIAEEKGRQNRRDYSNCVEECRTFDCSPGYCSRLYPH